MFKNIMDRVVGNWKTSIQGVGEGGFIAGLAQIVGLDTHTQKFASGMAIWRLVYGLFRK